MPTNPLLTPGAEIVIAPDKFKGTLTAAEVCAIVAEELAAFNPTLRITCAPMADGGEGTAPLIASCLNLTPVTASGYDALMRPVEYIYYSDCATTCTTTCAIDSASLLGLTLLRTPGEPYDVWHTTSYPLGLFIADRLAQGFTRIYIGVGGTATIDGGAGLLQALGARFYTTTGTLLPSPITAADLCLIAHADLSSLPIRTCSRTIVMLSDVDVPLLPSCASPSNSNSISASPSTPLSSLSFAPQKGVDPNALPLLHRSLSILSETLASHTPQTSTRPRFQGAGGGTGYALHTILGTEAHPGTDYLLHRLNLLTSPLPHLIITGEGRFDSQSLAGKVVGTLLHRAPRHLPLLILAGCADPAASTLLPPNATLLTCTPSPLSSLPTPREAAASLRTALRSFLSGL